MRVITLPANNMSVTIGQYVKAVKLAQSNPATTFKHGLTTWWPTTGTDIVRQFREGIHGRINQARPYLQRREPCLK